MPRNYAIINRLPRTGLLSRILLPGERGGDSMENKEKER